MTNNFGLPAKAKLRFSVKAKLVSACVLGLVVGVFYWLAVALFFLVTP